MKKIVLAVIGILILGGGIGVYLFLKKRKENEMVRDNLRQLGLGIYFDNPTPDHLTVFFDGDTLDLLPYGGAYLGQPMVNPVKKIHLVCMKDNKEILFDTTYTGRTGEHTFINPTRSTYITWTLRYISEQASAHYIDSVRRIIAITTDKSVIDDLVVEEDYEFTNKVLFTESESVNLLYGRSIESVIQSYAKNADDVGYRFNTYRIEDFIANYKFLNQLSNFDKHHQKLDYELTRLDRAVLITGKISGGTANPIVPFLVTKVPRSPESYIPIINEITSRKHIYMTPAYKSDVNKNDDWGEAEPYLKSLVAYDSLKASWSRGDTIIPDKPPLRKINITYYYEQYNEDNGDPVIRKIKEVKTLDENTPPQ